MSSGQKMLSSCQLIFVQMHVGGGQMYGWGSSTMLWSQLSLQGACVCGRQLSLKLVTVKPQTCQPNGLFICLKAMHYGSEKSQTTDRLQFVPSPFITYEEHHVILAEKIKCMFQSTLVLYTCTDMMTFSKTYQVLLLPRRSFINIGHCRACFNSVLCGLELVSS